MDQSIADFYKTATKRGFARTNLFRVNSIARNGTSNSVIYEPSADGFDNLFLYADGGIIPSRTIGITTIDFKTFKYNVPTTANYPESNSWTVTFKTDRDYVLRDVFEKWSVDTFDEHTSLSNKPNWWDCVVSLSLLANSGPAFKSNKPGVAATEPYSIRDYKLYGAFLINVGTMTYNLKTGNEIVNQTASIGLQYITSENMLTA